MKSIYITLCLLPALFFCCAVNAQVDTLPNGICIFEIAGTVYDGETKEPLSGATVHFKQINKAVVTNDRGEYSFSRICAGMYDVDCQYAGYKPITITFKLSQNINRNFILHADTCLLESVVIHGPSTASASTQSTTELRGKDLDRTRGLSLGELLRGVAGVNTLQTGPSIYKPIIQGMYGNRVLLMNNGVRQEGQQWGSEHAPEIDPFVASKITVVKGASGVRYGSDAVGGVILIDPNPLPKAPGIAGEINLVGLANNRQGVASGILEYGSKKLPGLGARIQGTWKRAGDSKTPGYYLRNTGFKEYNFSWSVGYHKSKWGAEIFYSQFNTKLGIFTSADIGNREDLINAIQRDVPLGVMNFSYDITRPFQNVTHELVKSNVYYNLSRLGKLAVILARQYNYRAEYDKHPPYREDLKEKPQVEFEITTHTANISLDYAANHHLAGTIGLGFISQANTTEGTVKSFIPNFKSYAGNIFFLERWTQNKVTLEAGVRYEHKWMKIYEYQNGFYQSPEFVFNNLSGSIGSIYTVNTGIIVRANLGTSFRPPAVNELFSNGLHHSAARIETGNSALRPEISYNLNVGLEYHLSKLHGEITAYNNFVQNYIYLVPELYFDSATQVLSPVYRTIIRGPYPSFVYKQVNAVFTGLDLTCNDSISSQLVLSLRLAILKAYNQTTNTNVSLTPPSNLHAGLKYHFNISKKISDSYLTVSTQMVARKKNVPALEDYKLPPPAYILFGLETGLSIHAGKQRFILALTVGNLLNRKYRDYLDRFRYYNDAAGRNFIIRLRVPFTLTK